MMTSNVRGLPAWFDVSALYRSPVLLSYFAMGRLVRVMLVKMLSISRRGASNLLYDILFFDDYALVRCQMDSLAHKLVTNSQTRRTAT